MDEEIKKLLEQNLELTKEIYRMTKKIKNYITFQKVMSVVYLLLIIVPIILSIVFLPPLIKNYMGQYQELLDGDYSIQGLLNGSGGSINLDNIDINKLPPQARQLLNK